MTQDYVEVDPGNLESMMLIGAIVDACRPEDFKHVVRYVARMDIHCAALLFKGLFRKFGKKLSMNPDWIKWLHKNQSILEEWNKQ